jgi:hypothetical protein
MLTVFLASLKIVSFRLGLPSGGGGVVNENCICTSENCTPVALPATQKLFLTFSLCVYECLYHVSVCWYHAHNSEQNNYNLKPLPSFEVRISREKVCANVFSPFITYLQY